MSARSPTSFTPITQWEVLHFLELKRQARKARTRQRASATTAGVAKAVTDASAEAAASLGPTTARTTLATAADASAPQPSWASQQRTIEVEWIEKGVLKYLKKETAAASQSRAIIAAVLQELDGAPGSASAVHGVPLTREHRLQVLNMRPTALVDVYLAVGDTVPEHLLPGLGYRLSQLMPLDGVEGGTADVLVAPNAAHSSSTVAALLPQMVPGVEAARAPAMPALPAVDVAATAVSGAAVPLLSTTSAVEPASADARRPFAQRVAAAETVKDDATGEAGAATEPAGGRAKRRRR